MSSHKTKIVCTIGPASRSPQMLEALIKAGMNVARLNLSHGDFLEHKKDIQNIRQVSQKLKEPVSILIDLPGVKMRIGKLKEKEIFLKRDEIVTLTTKNVLGTISLIPVSYKRLAHSVVKGGIIYLNDGFIQLRVEKIVGEDIRCKVVIGGRLLSNKGLNLPGAKLFIDPITKRDLEIIDFGLKNGVSVFGLSFVEKARDIIRVREFAKKRGKEIYLVAKIERKAAIDNFDEILAVTDGVMVARGDLGIETPIEQVPVVQKGLIRKANLAGRPVITATQMLGSMTYNVRPTRAEVNDVANAVLDGTDAIMLSEETAIGEYPIETVGMMRKIAHSAECLYHNDQLFNDIRSQVKDRTHHENVTVSNTVSLNVVEAINKLNVKFILTQTSSGSTARHISRLKPHCWLLAFSSYRETCEFLVFSYGVYPVFMKKIIKNYPEVIVRDIRKKKMISQGDSVIITERRFSSRPGDTDSLGIITL